MFWQENAKAKLGSSPQCSFECYFPDGGWRDLQRESKKLDKEKYHSLSLRGQRGLMCTALCIPDSVRVKQDDGCSL